MTRRWRQAAPIAAAAVLLTAPCPARAQEGACGPEALADVARSGFWEGLEPICEALEGLGHRPVEDPGIPDAAWRGTVDACRAQAPATFLCGATEAERLAWAVAAREHLESLVQRASRAAELCPPLDGLEPWIVTAPEARREALSGALGRVRLFCTDDGAPVPSEADVGHVEEIREVARLASARGVEPGPSVNVPEWGGGDEPSPQPPPPSSGEGVGRGGRSDGLSESAFTPAGMVDVAIQGLADFLMERAQAELEAYALDQLRHTLCDQQRARLWFRNTCTLLEAGPGTLRLSLGAGLRTAFRRDVLALPERALEAAPLQGDADALRYLLYFELAVRALEGVDPDDLARRATEVGARFGCDGGDVERCERSRRSVIAAGILVSASLERPALASLARRPFAVLAATLLGRALDEQAARSLSNLRDALRRLDRVARRTPSRRRGAALDHAARVARASMRALGAVLALDRVEGEAIVSLPQGIPDLVLAAGRGDLAAIAVEVTGAVASLHASVQIDADVVRGLLLAAEIATAESPDEVRAALHSVVAPVGAWRMKRERPMISVGGLVGLAGGLEWPVGGGISAPGAVPAGALMGSFGLDVSFPVGTSTFGLYVSVLDVGGLLSLPFGSVEATARTPSGEVQAELELEPRISAVQVVSPGLYLRWGLPDMPLVFGVGGSVVPLARRIRSGPGDAAEVDEEVSIVRLSAFLAVDVTLFPL